MSFLLFVLSFASVSFLPGLCMSLALSLGLSIGFKKTLWMMSGELFGIFIIILVCAFGASFILEYKLAFWVFKFCGALFLFYTAFVLFRKRIEFKEMKLSPKDKFSLALQGFLASVSNPKAWIFILSLLPPFLKEFSLILLCVSILFIEFVALCTYALGGSAFRIFLLKYIGMLTKFSAFCVFLLACFMMYDLFS
ncbi:threonine transporter RhtB [Campylobacter sp. MIT 99-7217]|uniref:LysE family translocator n=1 Tax=Campylobacter sp. MIT 99-7217 TaxID=535091 RepID=UPI00115882D2|nr:LysE family transporter [Campylobacter sp. MIT 99-7217]TQR33004.1 threonine transporter RhtB [Campylobacter sp. MIT 99-7217]